MSIAKDFPKGAFVTIANDGGEGTIAATSEKFGGRVGLRVSWKENALLWQSPSTLRVVPEGERSLDCDGFCGGTGVFRGGGIVENGVYKGFSGPCFRCDGHGKQTPKDRRRNSTYDNHYRRISL